MAFFPNAFSTRQYEIAAIADSATTLTAGTAVKITKIPTGITSPDFYCQVAAASSKDDVSAVISSATPSISNTAAGRIIIVNANFINVLMDSNAMKGDYIKVTTMDGKWGKCAAGETSDAQLMEAAVAGSQAWAKPIKYKV